MSSENRLQNTGGLGREESEQELRDLEIANQTEELEHDLERSEVEYKIIQLENQLKEVRASWKIKESKYELQKMKREKKLKDLKIHAERVSEKVLGPPTPSSSVEVCELQEILEEAKEKDQGGHDEGSSLGHIGLVPSLTQGGPHIETVPSSKEKPLPNVNTSDTDNKRLPENAGTDIICYQGVHDNPIAPQKASQPTLETNQSTLPTGGHDVQTPARKEGLPNQASNYISHQDPSGFQSAPDDDGLSLTEMEYYRELDIPEDGLELSFLDMDLEGLYEVASSLEAITETDIQQVKLLGVIHYYIFLRTEMVEDLQNAINRTEGFVMGTDINSRNYALGLKDLITLLMKKYKCTDSLDDLGQAIIRAEGMITLNDLHQSSQFLDLLKMKGIKAIRTRSYDEIEEAKAMWQTITATSTLVSNYLTTYEQTGDINDLTMALTAIPHDQPTNKSVKIKLVEFFRTRFKETGDTTDLQVASTILPNSHPIRPYILKELADSFNTKYENTRSMENLNMSIKIAEEALAIMPDDDLRGKLAVSVGLSNGLQQRFQANPTEDMADLRKAIEICEGAEAISRRHNNLEISTVLGRLSSALDCRGKWTNSIDDMRMAITSAEEALIYTPSDSPLKGRLQHNLAYCSHIKYERTGDLNDLQRAIELAEEAVEHFDRYGDSDVSDIDDTPGIRVGALSIYLYERFKLTGNLDDLELAIKASEKAIKLTPPGNQFRLGFQSNLAGYVQIRFGRTGSLDDLQMAIQIGEELLRSNIQERTVVLSNLAAAFATRFKRTGNSDDLDRAVKMFEEAIATTLDPSQKAGCLNNTSTFLRTRFGYTGNIEDLDMSIQMAEEAVALATDDHPGKAALLKNLATCFMIKFNETRRPSDFEKAISASEKGARLLNAETRVRIDSAGNAAKILAHQEMWIKASEMVEIAVELLPLSVSRELKQRDQQHNLRGHSDLSSTAASITLNAGKGAYDAVKLLELARGVMTGLRVGSRSDLTELRSQHPDIAAKFERLRDILDAPGSDTFRSALMGPNSSDESTIFDESPAFRQKAHQRFNANIELNKTIDQIRLLPNFDTFLRPPSASDLMAAASHGPIVIINISQYRCDAFLIEQQIIRSLPLPNLLQKDVKKHAEFMKSIRSTHLLCSDTLLQMFRMLGWLWDAAVGPILDALEFSNPPANEDQDEWPRVWWVPTGQLSLLPLHAAGYHHPGSTKTALDRVVSSYSSSIKALLYSRQNSQKTTKFTPGKAVLVSMDQTPKQADLPYTMEEVTTLQGLLPSCIATEKIKLERPNRQDVLGHLENCTIFHYAGHGESNSLEPEKSSLLINDWQTNPLTVEHLTELNFKRESSTPWLAYLSACSTSDSSAEKLHDEAINLVTACQLAGFQHVVGSLWEVSDKHSVTAAEEVYKTIAAEDGRAIDGKKVSLGVHRATRRLREITRGAAGTRALASHTETPTLVEEVDDEGCATECEGSDLESRGLRYPRKVRPFGYKEKEDVTSTVGNPLIWAAYVHVGP
ncbi:hypothetical protein TWF481_009761 [Arthrobotrys musiformis]|uniref:CHAT domain-containing protein n=1 Tax=Arthrobotrys musiformis TaxID=47236 RepID=A0AAV9W7A9_9PEZI